MQLLLKPGPWEIRAHLLYQQSPRIAVQEWEQWGDPTRVPPKRHLTSKAGMAGPGWEQTLLSQPAH